MEALKQVPQAFEQQKQRIDDECSVNIPIRYTGSTNWSLLSLIGLGKSKPAWLNVTRSTAGTLVMGTPGSVKTAAVTKQFIQQQIGKGFAMYISESESPDLAQFAYEQYLKNARVYKEMYGVDAQFLVINFDDPRRSNRVNPLSPELMATIYDAKDLAKTVMFNLNKNWLSKQSDFFVESHINYLQACIWYLKKCHDRTRDPEVLQRIGLELELAEGTDFEICTLPHVIEFLSYGYEVIMPLLAAEAELESIIKPFARGQEKGAYEQLEVLTTLSLISLSPLRNKGFYWAMTGEQGCYDINNENAPKILCVSNNVARQEEYGAALALIANRVIEGSSKTKRIKSSMIFDGADTFHMTNLAWFISSARKYRISPLLGIQDFYKLQLLYGDRGVERLRSNIGNLFSGQVAGKSAKIAAEWLNGLVNESEISMLAPGEFVGKLSHNGNETVEQQAFHAHIKAVEPSSRIGGLPILPQWEKVSEQEIDVLQQENFERVKRDVDYIIRSESNRLSIG